MHYEDQRTDAQKLTHLFAVVAVDRFMGGWGKAKKGKSRCAWALSPDADAGKLTAWVSARPEMKDITLVELSKYQAPAGTASLVILVCDKTHRSQK